MEYSRNVPWTTRFCSHANDLFIRPFNEFKREIDNTIIEKGVLSKNQLDLAYSIIAGVGIALVYFVLPPPVGGILAMGVLGLEWVKPDLFSTRTWAILQLAGGLYGIASTPRLLLLAFKIDSVVLATVGLVRAAFSALLCLGNIDRLMDIYLPKQDQANHWISDSDSVFIN